MASCFVFGSAVARHQQDVAVRRGPQKVALEAVAFVALFCFHLLYSIFWIDKSVYNFKSFLFLFGQGGKKYLTNRKFWNTTGQNRGEKRAGERIEMAVGSSNFRLDQANGGHLEVHLGPVGSPLFGQLLGFGSAVTCHQQDVAVYGGPGDAALHDVVIHHDVRRRPCCAPRCDTLQRGRCSGKSCGALESGRF